MTYNPQKNHPRQRVSETDPAPIDVLLEQVEDLQPGESEVTIEEEIVVTDTTGSPHRTYAIAAGVMAVFGLLLIRRKRRRRHRRAEARTEQ